MVVIPPMDVQSGEAIWKLLTGAAQDSWEAICKHSHPPELRPRRGGGGDDNSQHAEAGRGSSRHHNNNHDDYENNNNGNHGGREKTTAAASISTEAAAKTTAAAAKSTAAAEVTTTSTTPAAADTTSIAAAAPTTKAEAATPIAADHANDTTTPAAAGGATAETQAAGDTATAAAVAAATQTHGSGPDTTYINTNGQTTTQHAASTTAGAASTIGAAAATASPSASPPVSPSASSSPTLSSSGSGAKTKASNTGLIAGVVVGAVAILAIAFLLYRFRHSKYVKALCGCCGVGGRRRKNRNNSDSSSSSGGNDQDTHVRHMADSSARLVGRTSPSSLSSPTSSSLPAPALGIGSDMGRDRDRDSKHGYNDMSEKAGYYGHDDEKRELAYASAAAEARNLPLPTSPTAATSAAPSTSASSTVSSSSTSRPAGRRRSPSYSTFPSVTRSHNHNHSNSIALAQPGSLPTPPPTAVQKDRQASQSSQSSSRHASSPLALYTAPEGLVPPPWNSTTRQQLSTAGADENEADDVDDAASLAPTAARSSYTESVGGESISSSVLMSPSRLQWPVPPQTPPVSQFGSDAGRALSSSSGIVIAGRSASQDSTESGSTDTNSQGSGPLFDRVAIVPSHVPTVVTASALPVPRRPLTTVSSASNNTMAQAQNQNQGHAVPPMPHRGSMPTRASLSGPSSRSLMQAQAARRSVVVSSGSISLDHAVSGSSPPPRPQYTHPQYVPPTGYIPPHASVVTVHHTGQATSVRVPIARNPQRSMHP